MPKNLIPRVPFFPNKPQSPILTIKAPTFLRSTGSQIATNKPSHHKTPKPLSSHLETLKAELGIDYPLQVIVKLCKYSTPNPNPTLFLEALLA